MGILINNPGRVHTINDIFHILRYCNKIREELRITDINANANLDNKDTWNLCFNYLNNTYNININLQYPSQNEFELETNLVLAKLSSD